jgi:addiction module HigA family antidote
MTHNKMRAIHPGEILREEYLAPLEMSASALARELRVPAPRINDIVREKRGVTPDTALRLARYFGGDAQSWLNLQTAYDIKLASSTHKVGFVSFGFPRVQYCIHTTNAQLARECFTPIISGQIFMQYIF